MQCHHNAAELLLDAMKSTASSVALESITLQHSYHLKQKDLIKSKKEQYARVKKAMDNLKLMAKDPFNLQGNEHSKIQMAIYRTINENESLLNKLSNTKEHNELVKEHVIRDVTDKKKIDKPPQIIVEELQILSQDLRSLVEQLVFQVEVLKDENMTLKERVSYLEKERVKYLNIPTTGGETMYKNFSTISIGEEALPKDSIPVAIVPPPSKLITATERLNQKPHFDLSALKDD